MKRLPLKKALLIAGPVVLVAAFVFALRPGPLPVDLGEVRRGPLRVTLEEEGETRVRERFILSAPTAGRVLRIEAEPGDAVRTGDVLATLRPGTPAPLDARTRASLQAQVRSAESAAGRARAERERLKAESQYAEGELGRIRALGRDGIVSRERLEQAELGLATRKSALAAAEYEVRTAEHQLEEVRARLLEEGDPNSGAVLELRSPVDGAVLKRRRESESVVPAGEPLLEVGDPRDLEIVSDLLSSDAARLRPGLPVEIEPWSGGDFLHGRVRRVEPSGFTKISALGVEEQRVDVLIDLTDPPERWLSLGDAFRVEIRVVLWEGEGVLQIPTSGLFRDDAGWAVFAVNDGHAVRRQVEVGRQSGLAAEIVGGLQEGDRVILHPSAEIADGVAVEERSKEGS